MDRKKNVVLDSIKVLNIEHPVNIEKRALQTIIRGMGPAI